MKGQGRKINNHLGTMKACGKCQCNLWLKYFNKKNPTSVKLILAENPQSH